MNFECASWDLILFRKRQKENKKKIQQVLNLLQCQERYTYVVTRENDKRAEEKHPEADGGEELPNFCMSNLP